MTKHLAVLEAARLVATTRRGREKLHFLNAAPITEIADCWISPYYRDKARTLADLKRGADRVRLRHLHRDHAEGALAGSGSPGGTGEPS